MQRIETGWNAGLQHLVLTTAGTNEDLPTTILVEKGASRLGSCPHCLRQQKQERHGLSRTRRAGDDEIADLTLVEVEEIGVIDVVCNKETAGPQ